MAGGHTSSKASRVGKGRMPPERGEYRDSKPPSHGVGGERPGSYRPAGRPGELHPPASSFLDQEAKIKGKASPPGQFDRLLEYQGVVAARRRSVFFSWAREIRLDTGAVEPALRDGFCTQMSFCPGIPPWRCPRPKSPGLA